MIEHGVPKSTLDYMRKHKLGMFSKEDKKLVRENTPKSKALKTRSESHNTASIVNSLKKQYKKEGKELPRGVSKGHLK